MGSLINTCCGGYDTKKDRLMDTQAKRETNIGSDDIKDDNKSSESYQTWIFGYGSLISKKSRELTSSKIYEYCGARLKGYKRYWDPLPFPGVGVIKSDDNDAITNGILYRVDNNAIESFDARECVWGYKREAIQLTDIEQIPNKNTDIKVTLNDNDKFYVYGLPRIVELIKDPNYKVNYETEFSKEKLELYNSNKLPFDPQLMILTYVDLIMKGCKDLVDKDFMIEFVTTTYLWRNIYNDRSKPIRDAWDLNDEEIKEHDEILKKYVKDAHKKDYNQLCVTQSTYIDNLSTDNTEAKDDNKTDDATITETKTTETVNDDTNPAPTTTDNTGNDDGNANGNDDVNDDDAVVVVKSDDDVITGE